MLTVCIGGLFLIIISTLFAAGETGSAWLAIVILLVLMLAATEKRRDVKAIRTMRNYWADGGPDREE